MRKVALSVSFLVVAICGTSCFAASFQGLGDLPGNQFSSHARGVSADGSTVVGDGISTSGMEAFRWTATTGMTGLGDLTGGSFGSRAHAVSGDGSVIIGNGSTDSGFRAFRWTSSTGMVNLTSNNSSTGMDISADGSVIVGNIGNSAFRWTAAAGPVTINRPSGTNYGGSVTGISANGNVLFGNYVPNYTSQYQAYRWTATTGWAQLGFRSAAAASADGSVFIGLNDSYQPIRWTAETGAVLLGQLPSHTDGPVPGASAISADGSIIVGYDGTDQVHGTFTQYHEAFIWDSNNGMRSLQSVLTNEYNLDLTGWCLQEATGISADGKTIVGTGYNPSGQVEAWIAVIPEPATLLMLGLGGVMIRRKK